MAKEVEMLVGVSGIYVFYLLYGIVQERVYMLLLPARLCFFALPREAPPDTTAVGGA